MPAVLMLNANTRAYYVAMPDALGEWSVLVDEGGKAINVAWEFNNTGFEGVGAQHAMQAVVKRFERVDEAFTRMR